MARNEEKQQGRLNRLWLQKEREEGRLKDVQERRPKLSTLNSASSVKKWIPSIKHDIEYYLQQSQLTHYPERKIAEFQLHIEALQKEYKRFIAKLRCLDPSCKQIPWTPRAYCKRRPGSQDSETIVKPPRLSESHHTSSQRTGDDLTCNLIGCHKTSETRGPLNPLKTRTQPPSVQIHTNPVLETSEAAQDQPLSFDPTRLAVAAAAFRGPLPQQGSSQTQSLARVLQAGLPNLVNASLRQTLSAPSTNTDKDARSTMGSVVRPKSAVQNSESDCDVAERPPGKSRLAETTEERTGHVLGLDCYSSSDEECDT